MKKITSIQFVNYKAFYGDGEQNKVTIKDGKSTLIYGENGSGKSSIYEGIKQFFNSADNTQDVILSRHFKVPATETINQGQVNEEVIVNEVAVKVTFEDAGVFEEKTFGVPIDNVRGTRYISNANLLNSFLSYRELLRTYLMDDLKDKQEFRKKFATLLIETILAKNKNSGTQTSYLSYWEHLHRPFGRQKSEDFDKFKIGLVKDITDINLILNEILNYFEPLLKVQLILTQAYVEHYHSPKVDRKGNYPICGVDLEIELFGENVENDEENHLTVLNEARLSAIAISIYFSSLINAPQQGFLYKILFLDDIFIGLDMSNRIPLLQILTEFKKPILVETFDDATGEIIRVKQYETHPFFDSFQVFITTYDRYWFGVAKDWFETKSKNNWGYLELYSGHNEQLGFNTPVIYTSLDYLQKANFYYLKHDYPSCANHLRKALEKRIKDLIPSNKLYIQKIDAVTGMPDIKKINTLGGFIDRFISYNRENGIDASELVDLKNLKDWYFNPFSHDNIGTPIYKKEVEIAKKLVERLYNFRVYVLVTAGTDLYFQFSNDAGNTREYKIKLIENIRCIVTDATNIITDAKIECIEWNKDGVIEVPQWGVKSLFNLYNNKKNTFIGQNTNIVVNNSVYKSELKLIDNNQEIQTLFEI
jgi:energy-coupling factor transporter ATP-binding protein EcfA2